MDFLQHSETIRLVQLVHVCCVNWAESTDCALPALSTWFYPGRLEPAQQRPASLPHCEHTPLLVVVKQVQL